MYLSLSALFYQRIGVFVLSKYQNLVDQRISSSVVVIDWTQRMDRYFSLWLSRWPDVEEPQGYDEAACRHWSRAQERRLHPQSESPKQGMPSLNVRLLVPCKVFCSLRENTGQGSAILHYVRLNWRTCAWGVNWTPVTAEGVKKVELFTFYWVVDSLTYLYLEGVIRY